jgi:hypothetical protein
MALVAYWTRRKENDADPLQSINLTKYSRESEEVRHPSLLHVMIIIDIILRRDGQVCNFRDMPLPPVFTRPNIH